MFQNAAPLLILEETLQGEGKYKQVTKQKI